MIAARRGGSPELIGNAGVLVDQDDQAQFSEHMVQLALNTRVLEDWRQRARTRAVQCLDIRHASAGLDAVREKYMG